MAYTADRPAPKAASFFLADFRVLFCIAVSRAIKFKQVQARTSVVTMCHFSSVYRSWHIQV